MHSDENPYSAPAGEIRETAPAEVAPALWNPNAASLWSILFSPVFGGYLQMRNWLALGDAEKAKVSWYWVIASLVLIFAIVISSLLLPETSPIQKVTDRFGFILLIVWYLTHGKLQVAYVKEHFGNDYPRKRWGAPLGIAVAAVIAFLVFCVILGAVLGLLGILSV
jgi:hypothetical protein